ncbi:MAG: hypothetical protein NVS9B2_09930 [Steroidobacteraceae bacterium]
MVISVAALGMKTSLRELMGIGTTAIALIAAETVFLGVLVLSWIMLVGARLVEARPIRWAGYVVIGGHDCAL